MSLYNSQQTCVVRTIPFLVLVFYKRGRSTSSKGFKDFRLFPKTSQTPLLVTILPWPLLSVVLRTRPRLPDSRSFGHPSRQSTLYNPLYFMLPRLYFTTPPVKTLDDVKQLPNVWSVTGITGTPKPLPVYHYRSGLQRLNLTPSFRREDD